MRQVSVRLLPLLFLLYILCYLDRTNVSIAALQMNKELNFNAHHLDSAQVSSSWATHYSKYKQLDPTRVGARQWFARIAITWGVLACAMMWVRTPAQFYPCAFFWGGGGRVFPGCPLLLESMVSDGLPRARHLRHRDRHSAVGSIGWPVGRSPPGIARCRASLRLAVALPDRGSAARVTRDRRTRIPHGAPRRRAMVVAGAASAG